MNTRIVELILTETHRGDGTEENPHRHCPELWTKDGQLVVRYDPCETHTVVGDGLKRIT